jgi:hypothetical protein
MEFAMRGEEEHRCFLLQLSSKERLKIRKGISGNIKLRR